MNEHQRGTGAGPPHVQLNVFGDYALVVPGLERQQLTGYRCQMQCRQQGSENSHVHGLKVD